MSLTLLSDIYQNKLSANFKFKMPSQRKIKRKIRRKKKQGFKIVFLTAISKTYGTLGDFFAKNLSGCRVVGLPAN